ncbi:ribosome biogenesis GTPase [Entomoplasma freundtii]|uniref:Small ribosomal subunit biogenesis GTPase RsgA n=1 Tax=Entomoplasma freundtii TaxID=74700 RepID=A0A2K8NR50_9MOLU|nr:ribosome small subunit-dependent GTPase A [Entomoplasma freundtii]ATZ16264.1 ribosome biogenesis GTPase [Entomoplasma freundtii]TDY56835.1 ribosome biogenesis GTPase [Entomoplasma freundtii]
MKQNGIILKIDSHQSDVLLGQQVYRAEIKKSLMRFHQPLVGDKVNLEILDEAEKSAIIVSFEPQINTLTKPRLTNVDQVIIVTSLKEPDFNSYLLNKYLAMLEVKGIDPILIFTKTDLLTNSAKDFEIAKKVRTYEKLGYKVLKINNREPMKNEFEKLEKILMNKISVFVGQTGAGKSTTLNHFLTVEKQIRTQEISKSLNRGKHTTTTIQLYPLTPNILIADTPGFASFSLEDITPEDLFYNLRIFKPYLNQCKFNNCSHLYESGCIFLNSPNSLKGAQFIYEDYCKMIEEMKQKRGRLGWKNLK